MARAEVREAPAMRIWTQGETPARWGNAGAKEDQVSTVALDGSAGSGRDQRTFRSPILGSDSLPSGSTRKRLLAVNRTA